MKKTLLIILACLALSLLPLWAAAAGDGVPTVAFAATKGSVNGGFAFDVTLTAGEAFPADTPVAVTCKETGETFSAVFPAGKTQTVLSLPTQRAEKRRVLTFLLEAGEGWKASTAKSKLHLTVQPLPSVSFQAAANLGYVGRKMTVRVRLNNPGAVVNGRVFELRDQSGRLYGSAEWKNLKGELAFVFDVTPDMEGGKYFSVWWNRIRVSALGGGYASITDLNRPIISNIVTDQPYMCLTLDCCYQDSATDDVLAVLDKYGVKCTFFFTGYFERVFPESAAKIVAHGHEIGNHTTTHRKMTSWKVLQQISQLVTPVQEIQALLGVTPRLYRPPYGDHDQSLTALARGEGMEVVMWSMDSHDWDTAYRGKKDKILERDRKGCHNGAIILHHLSGYRIAELLDEIIPYIQDELGLKLVTVSELLEIIHHPLPEPRPVDTLTELPPDMP